MRLSLNMIIIPLIIIFENMASCDKIIACQDNFMLVGSEKQFAKVMDIVERSLVYLYCNFCSDYTDNGPVVWYYKRNGLHYPVEEITRENYNKYNVNIASNRTLKLLNFNTSCNSGIYTCEISAINREFTYVLEGVYTIENLPPSTGSFESWISYKSTKLDPINKQFDISENEPFASFSKTFNFTFRIKTHWEQWGKCESSTGFKGIRKRVGKCRLKVLPNTKKEIKITPEAEAVNQYYTTENYDIPCRSRNLNKTLPKISSVVKNIPDYIALERCDLEHKTSTPQALINEYKLLNNKQISENGNGVLVCHEGSNVRWFKDGKLLNSSFRYDGVKNKQEPQMIIDSHNSLYIFHATKKQEGNYSCVVDALDGTKMYQYDVNVFTKGRLLNNGTAF